MKRARSMFGYGSAVALAIFGGCGAEDEAAGPIVTSGRDGGGADVTVDGVAADGANVGDAPASDGNVASDTSVANDAAPDVVVDAGPCPAQAPTVPGLKIVDVTTATFSAGVFAVQAPGGNDWYVVEQGGTVKIVRNGAVLPTPFLDVTGAIGNSLGERGLLSIAFHPNYAQNGRFFVMATPASGNNGNIAAENTDAIVEYQRDPGSADVALPTKVRDIVVLPSSQGNHNGGTIMFGPGGFLFVATGDGGGGCNDDKPGQVQDTTTLFGKILRLDVDAAAPFAAAGNPYTDDTRVYHYGLRNPFRFNFDELTGDLFVGDVGQQSYEEITVIPGNAPGKNFGWPVYEGAVKDTCGVMNLGGPAGHSAPIVSIDRRGGSSSPFADYISIIGGRVYRGTAIPALYGIYIFGDYAGGELGAVRYCNGQAYGPVAIQHSDIPTPSGSLGNVSSFAKGNDGELYLTYGYGASRLGRLALK